MGQAGGGKRRGKGRNGVFEGEGHGRPEPRQGGPDLDGGRSGKPARPSRATTSAEATAARGAWQHLFGFHAVVAALTARRRRLGVLWATEAAASRLAAEIATASVTTKVVSADELTRRLGASAVHQGLMLEAGPLAPLALEDIGERSGLVIVLDQITDPHNVGAIIRTAAAFAVDAVVTTERHSPAMTGIVAKAASGGLDHVPIVDVVNLARALEQLDETGYQLVGLDSAGAVPLGQTALRRPLALVLGAEDKGLRRLTRERCHLLARLDMPGAIKSLNVSNACAVALTLARQKLPV